MLPNNLIVLALAKIRVADLTKSLPSGAPLCHYDLTNMSTITINMRKSKINKK